MPHTIDIPVGHERPQEAGKRAPLVPITLQILKELGKIFADRGSNYADFEDNARVFHQLMLAQGIIIPPDMTSVQFHAISNIMTKLARFATGDRLHEDTFLDIANYAVLIAAIQRRTAAREAPDADPHG